jgi:hypothetical protein
MENTQTQYPVRTIKLPAVPSHANASDYYFPINLDQVRELEESLFTRLEMLNLSKKAEDAAKVVFQEQIWQWFSDVQENSTTSQRGCIAPVVLFGSGEPAPNNFQGHLSNRWGYICPNLCEQDSEACSQCPPSFKGAVEPIKK